MGRSEEGDTSGSDCQGDTLPVRCEGALHGKDSLRNNRHCRKLQTMNETGAKAAGEEPCSVGEREHQDRRRQSEAQPCRQTAGPAGAQNAEGETYLAARRPGKGLCQRDEFGEGVRTAPSAAFYKFLLEVAKVGDRSAEGHTAQTQENQEDFRTRSSWLRWYTRIAGWVDSHTFSARDSITND